MSTEILCLIIFLIAVIICLVGYILILRNALMNAKNWINALMNGSLISESIATLSYAYGIDGNKLLDILEGIKTEKRK